MTSEIRVRRGELADAQSLATLAALCFTQAFAADNDPEHLQVHLRSSFGEAQQRRELLDPTLITLLACQGSTLMGFAQVGRREPPPCAAGAAVELARFYLEAGMHGRGVAQRLMAAVFTAARELRGDRIWLGVWERNPRAIAFYGKSGFCDVGSKDFLVGADRQTDRVLVADVPVW